MNISLDVLQKR